MSLLKIAHLSDPHFGTIKPGVREGLLATLAELKPDLVLFTGDITQRARASQFREAREFTDQLKPAHLVAVPGNHDIPLLNIFLRLFDPYRGFKKLFKNHLEKDFVYGDVVITGLNSTAWFRHVQGEFNLSRLSRRLSEKRPVAKVHIAAFHHPMDCAKKVDEKNLLRGADQAILILDRGGVDLVVGGHIHDPFVGLSRNRYPQASRNMILAVAGTATSWRTRKGAPNSFNWIEVDTSAEIPRLTLARYDQEASLRYAMVSVAKFERRDSLNWSAL